MKQEKTEENISEAAGAAVPLAPETVTLSKKEHEDLLKKIQDLEGLKDQFLRKAADYDNAKKRLEKDKEEFYRFATEKLIRELLPVLDNLNRAIEQAERANPNDAILKGIHLIEKHVFDILKKYGLSRIEALEKPFSAEFHEAIGEVETAEKPEGTVAEEVETGYLLHGRVLRPSRVRVAKPPGAPSPDAEKDESIT
jgi:molecular chaperone GrpE